MAQLMLTRSHLTSGIRNPKQPEPGGPTLDWKMPHSGGTWKRCFCYSSFDRGFPPKTGSRAATKSSVRSRRNTDLVLLFGGITAVLAVLPFCQLCYPIFGVVTSPSGNQGPVLLENATSPWHLRGTWKLNLLVGGMVTVSSKPHVKTVSG